MYTPGQAQRWRLQVSTLPAPPAALQLTEARNILQLQVTASITEELMFSHLKQLGVARDIIGLVCLRVKDGSGPPDALIHYSTEEQASKAKKLLHGSICNGMELDVKYGNRASFIFTGSHCKNTMQTRLDCSPDGIGSVCSQALCHGSCKCLLIMLRQLMLSLSFLQA